MEINFIQKNNDSLTIKTLLKNHYCMSDRLILKLKQNKRILKNGILTHVNDILNFDDVLNINLDFDEDNNIFPTEMKLSILYEDDCFLILNKPPHIPVHPSAYHYDNTLSNGVSFYFKEINLHRKIRPVNRLDKDTSRYCSFCQK